MNEEWEKIFELTRSGCTEVKISIEGKSLLIPYDESLIQIEIDGKKIFSHAFGFIEMIRKDLSRYVDPINKTKLINYDKD